MRKWLAMALISFCFYGKANALPPVQEPALETGYSHLDVNITGPNVVHGGQQITIAITLTNTTTSPIWIPVTLGKPEFDNEILVRGPYGEPKELDESLNLSTLDAVVQPGDKWQGNCTISNIYDMTMPGLYTVQARRHLRGGGIVESNTLTMTVAK